MGFRGGGAGSSTIVYGASQPFYRSGLYYTSNVKNLGSPSASIIGGTLNELVVEPFIITATTTFDQIAAYESANLVSTLRLGIYNLDAQDKPTTLILDAGTISADAGHLGGMNPITISQALTPGRYGLACVPQGATAAAWRSYLWTMGWSTGYFDGTGTEGSPRAWRQAGVAGALPNPMVPILSLGNSTINVYLRAA